MDEIFSEIGKEFGFENVQAEFVAFKEFKVKWQRSYKWADFRVSDYLEDAPDDVIRGLCRSLFSKIVGSDEEPYPETMCQWVTSDDFVKYKQPTYVKRCRNMIRSSEGKHKDLRDSYERLMKDGLAEECPGLYLTWTKETESRKTGNCSVLMKVVSIIKALDDEEVPDYVLDYCLYRELAHIMIGFDPTGNYHAASYPDMVNKYRRKEDAENWMSRNGFYV